MAENPLNLQFRKSKGGRPSSYHSNQCTQSNNPGSVRLPYVGTVNTQCESNVNPIAVATSSSSSSAASSSSFSSSQTSEKSNSMRCNGHDDSIKASELTAAVIPSESYSACPSRDLNSHSIQSSSSSNRYSAMSDGRYHVPPIAPQYVPEKASNGLLQKTQKYRRKKSENQTIINDTAQLQQKVDVLNYNQRELLQHQQQLKDQYERNLQERYLPEQQKQQQQHQYYQEQQQSQYEQQGSGNRQNHQQLQEQQLLIMHSNSSVSTNGRILEGNISHVQNQYSDISQTEGTARMQDYNHNRNNSIISSTSSSNRERIPISCNEESDGDDCVLRPEGGSLTTGCTADLYRDSLRLTQHMVDMNYNATAARPLSNCDRQPNSPSFIGLTYHHELNTNLSQKIDVTAERINLSIRAHGPAEYNAGQSSTADVSQNLLSSKTKTDHEHDKKRKREKLQYVNYVKKSRDAAKSLHETSVHHNISTFDADPNIGNNRMIHLADSGNGNGGCQSAFPTTSTGHGGRSIFSDRDVEQNDKNSSHSDLIDLTSLGRKSSSATIIGHYPILSASELHVQTNILYLPLGSAAVSNGSRAPTILTGNEESMKSVPTTTDSRDGNKSGIYDDDKSNHYDRMIDRKVVSSSSHDRQHCSISESTHNPATFGSSAGGSNGASFRDHASASDMEVTAMLLAMSGKGSGLSKSQTLLPSLLTVHSLPVNTVRYSAYPSLSHNDPIFRVDSQQHRSMPSSSSRLHDVPSSKSMKNTPASSPTAYLKTASCGSISEDEFCSQPL